MIITKTIPVSLYTMQKTYLPEGEGLPFKKLKEKGLGNTINIEASRFLPSLIFQPSIF